MKRNHLYLIVVSIFLFSCETNERILTENSWNLVGGEAFGEPVEFSKAIMLDRNGQAIQTIDFERNDEGGDNSVTVPAAGLTLRLECIWKIDNEKLVITENTWRRPSFTPHPNATLKFDGDVVGIDADTIITAKQVSSANLLASAYERAIKTYCQTFDYTIINDTLLLTCPNVVIKAVKYQIPTPLDDL